MALAWARSQHPEVHSTVEIGSYHALIASVAAGMGMGLVPRSVLALGDAASVLQRPLAPVWARQTTWLVTRTAQRPPFLEALWTRIAQGAQEGHA